MIQDLRNAVRCFLEQTQKVLTQREDDVHRGGPVAQVRMGFGKVGRSNAAHQIAQFREKVHSSLGTLQREQLLELIKDEYWFHQNVTMPELGGLEERP